MLIDVVRAWNRRIIHETIGNHAEVRGCNNTGRPHHYRCFTLTDRFDGSGRTDPYDFRVVGDIKHFAGDILTPAAFQPSPDCKLLLSVLLQNAVAGRHFDANDTALISG